MSIKVFDLKTGTVVFSKNVGEEVISLAWDGVMVIMGGGQGDIIVWDLAPGTRDHQLTRVRGHSGRVTSLAVQHLEEHGVVVVSGGDDRRVIVWSPVEK